MVLGTINEKAEKKKKTEEKIKEIDELLFSLFKPATYHGPQGKEVKNIKAFESACNLISQSGINHNPKKMTVVSFYNAIEDIQKQNKKKK